VKRLALGAVLVVVWVLLWDEPTLGQVILGCAVAAAVLVLLPRGTRSSSGLTFRPLPALHLLVWFLWQFVLSNLSVARAVLFPSRWVRTGVLHVELRSTSPSLAALVSNLTALTPGMQPVDGRPDGSALDVHVLSLFDEDAARRTVLRLEELVSAAFSPDGVPDPAPASEDQP